MIQTIELIADAQGSVQIPAALRLAPGARAVLVIENPLSPVPRPGLGRKWIVNVSEDFDQPLDDSFWRGDAPA